MPKENTHLYFSSKILKKEKNKDLKKIINDNISCFYLGAITPDVFYYAKEKKINKISDFIHGKDGNLTNKIIFDFLDFVKKEGKEKDLSFLFGFISHCALDIIFHPVVYYFSGNYYDFNNAKRKKAIYFHRHFETCLDKKVNNKKFFIKDINKQELKDLKIFKIISKKFDIKESVIIRLFKKQLFFNKLFKNFLLFKILYFLSNLKIIKIQKENFALFYSNLKKEKKFFINNILYQDLITGKKKSSNIKKLFNDSFFLAENMIATAYNYYEGKVSRKEAELIIRGESLNVGKRGCSTDKIKCVFSTLDR